MKFVLVFFLFCVFFQAQSAPVENNVEHHDKLSSPVEQLNDEVQAINNRHKSRRLDSHSIFFKLYIFQLFSTGGGGGCGPWGENLFEFLVITSDFKILFCKGCGGGGGGQGGGGGGGCGPWGNF